MQRYLGLPEPLVLVCRVGQLLSHVTLAWPISFAASFLAFSKMSLGCYLLGA